ncbi:MAG: hypothetical protein JWR72_1917 [Flavisolibacter sp.]|jgi:hypothetical protein|nr:hypothetical protein [Flavisolibacter sp.]
MALLTGCSPAKQAGSKTTAATKQQTGAAQSMCSRTVKYYIEKSIITNDGVEKESDDAGELTINPADGQFTMRAIKQSSSETSPMQVESCSLTPGMKSGQAVYTMKYDKSEGENTVVVTMVLKVEAVNGSVSIAISITGKEGGIKGVASNWEVVE